MAEITKSLKETAGKITGGLGRGLSKLSSVFKSNKIEPAMSETSGSMSNTQYLGSIYQLMVDSDEERRLEYQRELNLKEESDSEEQRQHQEIIKALTLRRVPKRKKGISKEQKQSEKVEKTAKSTVGKKTKKPKVPKKGEPAKKDEPAKKPTDAEKDKRKEQKSSAKDEQIKKDKKSADDAKAAADKKTADAKTSAQKKEADRAQEAAKKKADNAKAAEEAKKASDARRAADDASKKRIAEDRAKKEAETKAKKEAPKTEAPKKEAPRTEAPKKEAPKTAEPVKQTQKPAAPKPAEPVKAPETVKPPTATQKPPAAAKPSAAETATKIGIGTGIAAATTGLVPILAKAESPDYNLLVYPNKGKSGIKPPKPLTQMKIGEVLAFQDEMSKSKMYPSNAVGKYQIIQSTLKEGAEKLKIPLTQPFDEKTQDRLYYEFLTGSKRKNLGDYLSGKVSDTPENLAEAQLDLAKEFASFGVPYRIWRNEARKKNGDLIWDARWIEPGQSYYVGAGGNKASVTPQTSAKAIKEERLLRLNKEKSTAVPSTPNSGTKADQASIQNKDMKVQNKPAPVNVQQNTTNVSNTSESSTPPKVDDRPAHKRK